MDGHDLRYHGIDGDGTHIRVIGGMVGKDVALVDDPADQRGVGFGIVAVYEEYCLYILFLQNVQNGAGEIQILIAHGKGQVELAVIRGDKVGIVLAVLILQIEGSS